MNADPNQVGEGDIFPLYMACSDGTLEIVKLLLTDPRCDVNKAYDYYKYTSLEIACRRNRIDIIEYMLQNCDDIVIPKSDKKSMSTEVLKLLEDYRKIEVKIYNN